MWPSDVINGVSPVSSSPMKSKLCWSEAESAATHFFIHRLSTDFNGTFLNALAPQYECELMEMAQMDAGQRSPLS